MRSHPHKTLRGFKQNSIKSRPTRTISIRHGTALRLYGAPMGYTITADSDEAGRTAIAETKATFQWMNYAQTWSTQHQPTPSNTPKHTKTIHQAIPDNTISVYHVHELCWYRLAFATTGHDFVHQSRGHLQLLQRNVFVLMAVCSCFFCVFPRDLVSDLVRIMLEDSGEVLTSQMERGIKATHCDAG